MITSKIKTKILSVGMVGITCCALGFTNTHAYNFNLSDIIIATENNDIEKLEYIFLDSFGHEEGQNCITTILGYAIFNNSEAITWAKEVFEQVFQNNSDSVKEAECLSEILEFAVGVNNNEIIAWAEEKLEYALHGRAMDENTKDCLTSLVLSCVLNSNKQIIEWALQHGADINRRDKLFGATALHLAASHNNVELLNFLLDKKDLYIVVDMIDKKYNDTPLQYAVEAKHAEAVKILLRHGANPEAPNKYGLTPIARAKKLKNQEIIDILEKDIADSRASFDRLLQEIKNQTIKK